MTFRRVIVSNDEECLSALSDKDKALGERRLSLCRVCGKPAFLSTGYMLEDKVWLEANKGSRKGNIHLGCLSEALGRDLIVNDFKLVPLNYPIFYGYMLKGRE